MTDHTLKDFLRKVRQDTRDLQFPLLEGQPFQTITVRTYTSDPIASDGLAFQLEDELSFLTVVNEMCVVLEHEDIPKNKALEAYIRNLRKIFSTYATEGHYAGRYFLKILSKLDGFLSFVRLSNQRDDELLVYLQSLSQGKSANENKLYFTSQSASFYLNCKTRYASELQEYQHIFHDFLKRESEKSQGLKVITRTEQCLLTLTDMIHQTIDRSQGIAALLSQYNIMLLLAQHQVENN
jgi:hypothetical protein